MIMLISIICMGILADILTLRHVLWQPPQTLEPRLATETKAEFTQVNL